MPGITVEHFNNGAPGNVATLSIRGAGAFVGGSNAGYEVLVLQDGEPLRNGQYGDFDLSTLTPAIYSRVEVVKGVGGTSLFGANTIGGTVNLVTRDPLATEGGELIYAIGGFGTQDVNLSQTDTIGRFGYLFDLHSINTDGYIPPSYRVEFPNSIVTNPTLAFGLKSGLAKILRMICPAQRMAYFRLHRRIRHLRRPIRAIQVRSFSNTTSCYNGPTGYPSFYGFPGNYVTNIQPKYAFDLHTLFGGGDLELRAYHQWLYRIVDGENAATPPPPSCCYIETEADRLTGLSALWTKEFGNNSFAVAVGGNGDYFNYGSLTTGSFVPATKITFSPSDCKNNGNCQATQIERTVFVATTMRK